MNTPLRRFLGFSLAFVLAAALLGAADALSLMANPASGAGAGRAVAAGEKKKEEAPKLLIENWLLLGPLDAPLPAFNDEGEGKSGAAQLLEYEHIPLKDLKPVKGAGVTLIGGKRVVWKEVLADTSGVLIPADTTMPHIAYLAAYMEVPRWMKVEFQARSANPFDVTIDGTSVISQKEVAKQDDPGSAKKGEAKLEEGKHLLIVKTVYVPADTLADWRICAKVWPGEGFDEMPVVSTDPSRTMNIGDVLDAPAVGGLSVSPDGSLVAVQMSKRTPPDGKSEDWVEIRRLRDGELVSTLTDMSDASNWRWGPIGHRLAYMVSKDGAGTVRVKDFDTDDVHTIVEDVKDLSGYVWSPDGTYIAYTVSKEPEKDDTGVKRMRGLYDRRRYERTKSYLYVSSVPSGITREMTAGEYSTYIYDIHPDSRSLLIGRTYEELSERPYSILELDLLNLNDQSIETLWKGRWLNGAEWSPDGKKILITAGASEFGGVGLNLPEGTVPNDYDTQAYIFDPETKTADPITRDFAPTIESAYWPKPGGDIYFVVEEGEFVKLYRYNVSRRSFKSIDLGFDVVLDRAVAQDKPLAALTGSSADHPERLYAVDLAGGRVREIADPSAEWFKHVAIGEVKNWNFTTSSGLEIIGRIHYPPHFDPDKKWPCIVYYYGGTMPVDRRFGGRYPKNLWASMGYVVYVLQPSGATGFGQALSAVHVNDWGKTTADEIIDGTKKFIEAHDFIDPKRVGCIGASYGGFMTELLVTKTDIFAAAVSHAGISDITSYWGVGYWGYEYSAVATANSFPWNRPDIFIDQSPLFSADKVNTPLLLLHGGSDTNVPRGESDQMYTALKLLGKEVEYIRIEGEDHWIIDYKKRIVWSNAIISWFDRWLKDEPQWWDDMYPPLDHEAAKPAKAEGAAEEGGPREIGIKRVELERYGTVLLGDITMKDVMMNLQGWDAGYFDYSPDQEVLSHLKGKMDDVKMVWVIGTWCPDCHREIPRLWKILDAIGYPLTNVKIYGVASSRFTKDMPIPAGVLQWSDEVRDYYDARAVPTIILTRDGKELGRIVEAPDGSLEVNLLDIVSK